jgi:uroporphyrinogen decarboxylase
MTDEPMTPRQRFIAALERRPLVGLVPHFELVYFLTMETFGRVHPAQRRYAQWLQMSERERHLHRLDMARLYIETAERFDHSAIFLHPHEELNEKTCEEIQRTVDLVRELSGDRYFLMVHGDATFGVPDGTAMLAFSYRLADDPQGLKDEAQRKVEAALAVQAKLAGRGLDGFGLCTDYCLNAGPFLSPQHFAEFVAPYLKQLIAGQRELGYYAIKHSDGNIMPILDQIVDCRPHAVHSLDPQAGVDIAEVKRCYGNRVCLVGNVNCGLMDTGTDAEVIASARYALRHGMPGGGYIFSTSNCVYTGMRPERYELILKVWREEGVYGPASAVVPT